MGFLSFIFNTIQHFLTLFVYIFLPPILHFLKKWVKKCKFYSPKRFLYLLCQLNFQSRWSTKRYFFGQQIFICWPIGFSPLKIIENHSRLLNVKKLIFQHFQNCWKTLRKVENQPGWSGYPISNFAFIIVSNKKQKEW